MAQEMSSYESERITDPKKQFLIKLINMIDSVGWLLAAGQERDAMKTLAVLLGRIQINDGTGKNEKLRELQKKMVYEYQTFLPTITDDETRIFYHQVSEYMNETYFKELNWITPRIKGEAHLS